MFTSSSVRPSLLSIRAAALLTLSAGFLLGGCSSGQKDSDQEFVFTADDAARFDQLVRQSDTQATGAVLGMMPSSLSSSSVGSGVVLTATVPTTTGSTLASVDPALVAHYNALRSESAGDGKDHVQVTNTFVNMRVAADKESTLVQKIDQGAVLELVEFPSAGWARVKTAAGIEGYVSLQYVSLLASSDQLPELKKRYEGLMYVDYPFLNVRSAPDRTADKIGELPGQSFVRPQAINGPWAQIPFNGKTGYVSAEYLTQFSPPMTVRQESFTLPILQYNASQTGVGEAIAAHVKKLKADGVSILTLADVADLLEKQEKSGGNFPAKGAVLTVTGVTSQTIGAITDTLKKSGVTATLFVSTQNVGLSGITQQTISQLVRSGFDVQSAGHTGDDLRALTDSQLDIELRQSRQLLSEAGATVFSIGYPDTGVNDRVMQHAAAAGYLFGVGGSPERTFRRSQFLKLPSLQITSSMLPDDVARVVEGK